MKAQKTELKVWLKAWQQAVINVPNLERFIEDMQKRLPELDKGKRLALGMLCIRVYFDVKNVEVTGVFEFEARVLCCSSDVCRSSDLLLLDA